MPSRQFIPQPVRPWVYLLKDQGEIDAVEDWFRPGAKGGDPQAMNGLGLLFEARGRAVEAEPWFHGAAAPAQTNVRDRHDAPGKRERADV